MADLSIEYRGSTIRFNENSDEWSCLDHNASNPSLAKVKAKIDRILAAERKAKGGVAAIHISMSGAVDAGIVSRAENGYSGRPQVWARRVGFHNDKASRHKDALSDLVYDTPENRATLAQAAAIQKEAAAIAKKARELIASIPRVKVEEIAHLDLDD